MNSTKLGPRRYRVTTFGGDLFSHSEEYSTAADADRALDAMPKGRHWVCVLSESENAWRVLSYDNAIFHDSGRDVLIDIDGTGRWELFSSCANQHDARNMAKHYQEQHNPQR